MHFTGGMSTAMFILYPVFLQQLGADEMRIRQVMMGQGGRGRDASVRGAPARSSGQQADAVGAGLLNLASILGTPAARRDRRSLLLLTVVHVAVGTLFASYFTYATHRCPRNAASSVAMFGVMGMMPNGLGPPLSEWLLHCAGSRTYFAVAAGF